VAKIRVRDPAEDPSLVGKWLLVRANNRDRLGWFYQTNITVKIMLFSQIPQNLPNPVNLNNTNIVFEIQSSGYTKYKTTRKINESLLTSSAS